MEHETWTWSKYALPSGEEWDWHWARPDKPLSLPDFIRASAHGEAKLINGVAHVKKEGPDPVIVARMNDAMKTMQDVIAKKLYEEGTGNPDSGLFGLLRKKGKLKE